MNKRKLGSFASSVMLIALGFPAEAQQPGKVPHIGILTTFSPSVIAARIEGFRQGLRELGYVETFYELCQAPVIFYAARICCRAIFARW